MNNSSRIRSFKGLKKVAVLNIIALVLSMVAPLSALADHFPPPQMEIDSESLVQNGSIGRTAFKMYFWLRNGEEGHASQPAINTSIEIRRRVGECNLTFADGALVKRLITGVNFNPGFFYGPFVWDGSNLGGSYAAAGPYCYRLESFATDAALRPIALTPTPFYGTITLNSQLGSQVSPPSWKAVPLSDVLVHSVNGSPITLPGAATVSYTAHQTIRNGLIFRIMNGATVVASPATRAGVVLPDTGGTFSWNGKDSTGNNVAPGTYQYRLVTLDAGTEIVLGQGNIVVQTAPSPPPQPNISITDISASLSPFSPARNETTQVRYTLDQPARVGVEILRGGLHYTLVALPAPGSPNNGVAGMNTTPSWNGYSSIFGRILNVYPDDNGSYEIRVTAVGANGVAVTRSGSVIINNTPPATPIEVSNVSVSPSTFSPLAGGVVNIYYTLNKPSDDVILYIYDRDINDYVHIATVQGGGAAGRNVTTWDGFSSELNRLLNLTGDNGPYGIIVQAYDEDGVTSAYDRSVNDVTINNVVSQNNLVISNVTANPSSFSPAAGQTITISYTLSNFSASALSATILNSSNQAVYSATFTNLPIGTNQLTWTGVDNLQQNRLLNQVSDNGSYTIRISATGSNGVVAASAYGYVTINNSGSQNLVISNVTANPSSFSPLRNETTSISFSLSQAATSVSATILDPSSQVVYTANLSSETLQPGSYQFIWNGINNQGRYLTLTGDNGAYQIRINGVGGNGVSVSGPGSVTINNGVSSGFTLSDKGPTKSTFNPEIETTDLRYFISHDADVRVKIYAPAVYVGNNPVPSSVSYTPVRDLMSLTTRYAGSNVATWNGRDNSVTLVQTGVYPYVVEATSRQNGSYAYFWGYVTVNRTSGTLVITDLGPSVYSFNPSRGETVTIRFELNVADAPTVAILQGGINGTVVRNFTPTLESSTNNRYVYRVIWDGRDGFGRIMPNDAYTYRIRASVSGRTEERSGYVRVEGGTTVSGGGCAGFSDVSPSDPLCAAVQYVVNRGVFVGDAGLNTLRVNDRLSRAETARVIQSAYGYPLEAYDEFRDGDLGFSDLNESAWYMPYMKTFVIRGVMRGYPDGKMRPVQKMKTTELFKIFVEGVYDAPRALANFTLNRNVRQAPFNDTPVRTDTKWYLPYADFAQRYNLAPSEPYFYPAREITRGKVILLIYESSQRNVITYGVTNPSARTASDLTYVYGSRSPTYYRSSSGTYTSDAIY